MKITNRTITVVIMTTTATENMDINKIVISQRYGILIISDCTASLFMSYRDIF